MYQGYSDHFVEIEHYILNEILRKGSHIGNLNKKNKISKLIGHK
jgi:hypothetical protein